LIGFVQFEAQHPLEIITLDDDGHERPRPDGVFRLAVPFRLIAGFPPRAFLRLGPVGAAR